MALKLSIAKKYWSLVHRVVKQADILLLILDARLIHQTRNISIERMVHRYRKPLIYVINKADLVTKEDCEIAKEEFENCVFMSAKKHMGTNVLRSKIMAIAGSKSTTVRDEKKVIIGVLGFPNTGKSSVINALAGRASAKTAPVPGYTKAIQLIKISSKMYMLDTPGVIPYTNRDEKQQAFTSAASPHGLKHPLEAAVFILNQNKLKIKTWFDLDVPDEKIDLDFLEEIAKKRNFLKKGGIPDINRASMMILHDWQQGKLK